MLRVHHWVALLAICFWVDYVAAVPLPGVQWSRLSVWEASALADVWSRAGEYLDFRSYALCGLSDLGYFDHLLEDFARGPATGTPGMTCPRGSGGIGCPGGGGTYPGGAGTYPTAFRRAWS